MLTYQRRFRVGTTLILFIYLRTRTWSGKIRFLILVNGIALRGFVELLCLFKTGSLDLIKSGSVQLPDRVQRCIGVDQAAIYVDLTSIDEPRAHTLYNYLTKERQEHLLTPSFPCLTQDAMIGNRVVQPVTKGSGANC